MASDEGADDETPNEDAADEAPNAGADDEASTKTPNDATDVAPTKAPTTRRVLYEGVEIIPNFSLFVGVIGDQLYKPNLPEFRRRVKLIS